MLEKTFDAATVEPKIAKKWEEAGAFKAGAGAREGADPYCIVIPPPNVTGSLHMGHALNNTLQDILIRHQRMLGNNVLWQPGMDHAGIATQMVVERQLAEKGELGRAELGRDAFIDKVWEWKETSGGTIINQLQRLGASCDWSRERFTMDEGLSEAVTKAFVELYNEGLIYRGKRLVNWDPKFETAISDVEVENLEVDGHMWHFKYPLAGGETYEYVEKDEDGNVTLTETRDYISIATTRPETMLGDGAVAVHPTDERYAPIVGKLCEIPVGPKEHRRLIPIITDEYPDPDFGSGAVKITGAHDFNDYGVAKRNNIPLYRLMDTKAAMRSDGEPYEAAAKIAGAVARGEKTLTEAECDAINLVPDELRGLDRYEARKAVIEQINADGLAVMIDDPSFEASADADAPQDEGSQDDLTLRSAEGASRRAYVESKKIMQPFGDRSKVVIEPMLTDQWFCDAETLAKPALEAVKGGATKFVPDNWSKTYYQWMENIEPWCISRQLWWGHRIPAWYGPAKEENGSLTYDFSASSRRERFIAKSEADAIEAAKAAYGPDVEIHIVDAEDFGSRHAAQVEVSGRTYNRAVLEPSDGITIYRDPDVLDTWFSSALWPFSTLGWPDKTKELDTYYQTDVLVTGFDIIFFWVARMMMFGMHFMKDGDNKPVEPFHTVYMHALVRDEDGVKMSKSIGNVIDPLDLIQGIDADGLVAKRTYGLARPQDAPKIEKRTRQRYPDGFEAFGADALRFTLAIMAAQGRDLKLSVDRVAGYRNFGTKLWNATRFAQMNGVAQAPDFESKNAKLPVNRWVLTELTRTAAEISKGLEAYRFNDAADAAYKFVWHTFCDWYLELLKPVFNGEDEAAKAEAQACAAYVLDEIYKLLHPFMPFMTEELWALTADRGDQLLCHAQWPEPTFADDEAAAEINWLVDLVSGIRSVRAEMNVPPSAKAPLVFINAGDAMQARIERNISYIEWLARAEGVSMAEEAPAGSAQIVAGEVTACLPLGTLVDKEAEMARIDKALGKVKGDMAKIEGKLNNERFVQNAKPEVVQAEREKLEELKPKVEQLDAARARIEAL